MMKTYKNIDIQKELEHLKPDKLYDYGDSGNGELFAKVFKDVARFNITANYWYVYNGKIWIEDTRDLIVNELAIKLKKELIIYAANVKDGNEQIKFLNNVKRLINKKPRRYMIDDAKSNFPISKDLLDTNAHLINLQNGTLDLKTFEFREHRASDLLSMIANVSYDPNAKSELWDIFIDDIMQGNKEKINYLQKALGYGMTTDTSLETCFILWGPTSRNGKGTLIESSKYMLGDYAKHMNPESLAHKDRDSRQATGDIARLKDVRFLSLSEPPKKMIFNIALLKTLLGRDTITARHLRQAEFEFIPQFKLFINTNHLPIVNDDTLFSSGRVNVIKFDRHFEEYEQDRDLKNKFKTNETLSSMLNWFLQGLRNFYEEGLKPPKEIEDDTYRYRSESDKIGRFIDECLAPSDKNISGKTAYEVYETWCKDNGYGIENKSNFYTELRSKNMLRETGTVKGKTVKKVIIGYKISEEWETNILPWYPPKLPKYDIK